MGGHSLVCKLRESRGQIKVIILICSWIWTWHRKSSACAWNSTSAYAAWQLKYWDTSDGITKYIKKKKEDQKSNEQKAHIFLNTRFSSAQLSLYPNLQPGSWQRRGRGWPRPQPRPGPRSPGGSLASWRTTSSKKKSTNVRDNFFCQHLNKKHKKSS